MYNTFGFWPFPTFFLVVIAIWSLAWKGVALWKAAHHEQKGWFVALLIVNTAGLLEIAYILFFQKTPVITSKKAEPKKTAVKKSSKKRKRK